MFQESSGRGSAYKQVIYGYGLGRKRGKPDKWMMRRTYGHCISSLELW
jgi:hypothetical protein